MSADETLPEHERRRQGGYADATAEGDAQMIDPAHFEDEDDDDADAPPPPVAKDDKYKSTDSGFDIPDDGATTWALNTGDSK